MILLASTLINATEHTIVYILDLSQLLISFSFKFTFVCDLSRSVFTHIYIYIGHHNYFFHFKLCCVKIIYALSYLKFSFFYFSIDKNQRHLQIICQNKTKNI